LQEEVSSVWPQTCCNESAYYFEIHKFSEDYFLGGLSFCCKTPVFYEAFQHFFDGFQKSVGRLRSKFSVAVGVAQIAM
jgi:hypothetical protein